MAAKVIIFIGTSTLLVLTLTVLDLRDLQLHAVPSVHLGSDPSPNPQHTFLRHFHPLQQIFWTVDFMGLLTLCISIWDHVKAQAVHHSRFALLS